MERMQVFTNESLVAAPTQKELRNQSVVCKPFEKEKFETKQVGLSSIIQRMSYYDFDPPYQRGDVWKERHKKDLIVSILRKIPINAIHFVQKTENSNAQNVLDGKQRLTAIKEFTNNEWPIVLEADESGTCGSFYWKDICASENSTIKALQMVLEDFQVTVTYWRPMSIQEQRDIFVRINYSERISDDEEIYCAYFLARKLMRYIWKMGEEAYKHMDNRTGGPVVRNDRFAGTRFIHNLSLVCWGDRLDQKFRAQPMRKPAIKHSAKELDDKLMELGFTAKDEITPETIDGLGMTLALKHLKRALHWAITILEYAHVTKKDLDKNIFLDFLIYLIKGQQDKALTSPLIEQNLKLFHGAFLEYMKQKTADMKHNANETNTISERIALLEKIIAEAGIDCSKKTKRISPLKRSIAKMEAPVHDPVSGALLTDRNIEMDHVVGKAVAGDTTFAALSSATNRQKSALTGDTVDKIGKYINEAAGESDNDN